MKTIILANGVLCLGAGLFVLWNNPRRFSNQVFALISVLVASWLATVAGVYHVRELSPTGREHSPLAWFRANGALMVLLSWSIWLLNAAVMAGPREKRATLRHAARLLLPTIPLLMVCGSDWYIPDVAPWYRKGWGYFVCVSIGVGWLGWLLFRAAKQVRGATGLRRVELWFLGFNLTFALLLVMATNGLGNLLGSHALRSASFFIFLSAFFLAAWAITFHRTFNAGPLVVGMAQRVVFIVAAASALGASWQLCATFLPAPADLVVSAALTGAAAWWLDWKSRAWLRLGAHRTSGEMRHAVIALARAEPDAARLAAAFTDVLRQHCATTSATLLLEDSENHAGPLLRGIRGRPGHDVLCELGAATPESLEQRRPEPATADLQAFLAERSLGALVAAPRGSPLPTLIIALGTKKNGWPFTTAEVECVQQIAELMDNILTRLRLRAQAALQAKTEHLAMLSRGLAHDLKNLLTPVSSFLVHTDGSFAADSIEAEVHAAARHSVRVMTEYVREALFFSERLQPQWERVELAALFQAVRNVTAERAAGRQVTLATALDAHEPVTADRVLLQRMLANLVSNAIDASAPGQCVTLRATNGLVSAVRFHVIDRGTGIAPEHLSRIFEPYFTTKEFRDDVRGFGLGLTICQKIARLHDTTLRVESAPGQGTRVIFDLPAAPRRLAAAPACVATA